MTLNDRNALGQSDGEVLGMLAASLGLAPTGSTPSINEILGMFDPAQLPREPWQLEAKQLDPKPDAAPKV